MALPPYFDQSHIKKSGMDKNRIRQDILSKRLAIPPTIKKTWEASIFKNLKAVLSRVQGGVLSLYLSFRGEVETENFLDDLQRQGYKIALPKVIGGQKGHLKFFEYKGPDHMAEGFMGILEPDETCPEVLPDIMIVPLVGFDKNCNRLGYGAGHHDKTFDRLKTEGHDFVTIGVAYECQKCESLPCEAHDYPLDYVVTEKNIYKNDRKKDG